MQTLRAAAASMEHFSIPAEAEKQKSGAQRRETR